MSKVSALIMTGDKLRHSYFASQLLRAIPNSALLVEKQPSTPWGSHSNSPTGKVEAHFNAFAEEERRYFGMSVEDSKALLKERTLLILEDGEINSDKTILKIQELNPTVLVSLSTSLLKEPLITAFGSRRILNLHAGLSPYYRGSGTNVFPFLNNELQYVGMTVHYIDIGIDSGDIVLQGRPTFEPTDNTHTIGCKNVILGTNLMRIAVTAYLEKGPPVGIKQDTKVGRLYLKKDFTDKVIEAVESNIRNGLVAKYASLKEAPEVKLIDHLLYE